MKQFHKYKNMTSANWKNGLRVDIQEESGNLNKFLIVVGENGTPFTTWEITNGMFYGCWEKFYIEYEIKIYECDINTNEVRFKYEFKFDPTNKNFYFELYPKSQDELDIWINYLTKFANIKKCFLFIKNIDNMKISLSERMQMVDNEFEKDYYAHYKICWDDNLDYNPGGILDINSYELINNCLMRL